MCFICKKSQSLSEVHEYNRCRFCGAYISKLIPSNSQVQKVLEEHADSYILSQGASSDNKTHAICLNQVKKVSKRIKTVLDFGCGKGDFVKFLLERGYNAFAYDKSENLKKYLKSQNIPFFKNEKKISNNFDLITCFDVIEHTTDPKFILDLINSKLKIGGYLALSTPNANGFSARILGTKWWVFGPTAHYVLFSPNSLKFLLERSGFKMVSLYTDTLTPWFIPTDKISSKVLNKLIYLLTYPFHKFMFSYCLGDNLTIIAQK